MKRKTLLIAGILVTVLALIFVILVPAAPLFVRLGVEPVCIQGDFPNLRVDSCPQIQEITSQSTPLPLPSCCPGEGWKVHPKQRLCLRIFENFEDRGMTFC